MTKYAKLDQNSILEWAPTNYAGVSNFNQDEALMLEHGYKPVIESVHPEGNYRPVYTETETEIVQSWEEVVVPEEDKAQTLRNVRDSLLAETDKTMLPDYPVTDEEREKYKAYRQYLRDIPQNPDFPDIEILSFEEWQ